MAAVYSSPSQNCACSTPFSLRWSTLALAGVAVVGVSALAGYVQRERAVWGNLQQDGLFSQMAAYGAEGDFLSHLSAPITGGQDWVRFSHDCAGPVLGGLTLPETCRSAEIVRATYGVDLKQAYEVYLGRMQDTAQAVQSGQFAQREELQTCIDSGSCVAIPLLPEGVDADTIDPYSGQHWDVRQAFWGLVERAPMNAAACSFIPLCAAFARAGVTLDEIPATWPAPQNTAD